MLRKMATSRFLNQSIVAERELSQLDIVASQLKDKPS